jgi:hypothetical protein
MVLGPPRWCLPKGERGWVRGADVSAVASSRPGIAELDEGSAVHDTGPFGCTAPRPGRKRPAPIEVPIAAEQTPHR